MKSILISLLTLVFLSCQGQEIMNADKRDILFKAVNVIPMNKEEVLQNQDLLVSKGKIAAIGDAGKVKYGRNVMVIDGKGKYLMPGLAEMHAHVPPIDDLQPMKEVLLLFAVNGVTTIRGMLGHIRHLELREKIKNGDILGPRFYTSGPSFSGGSTKTPEAASALVRQQKQAGYDFLKLHPGLSRETFDALAKTAKEVGIPFAGHVSFDVGVSRAIDAGYASIDHLDGFVESLVPGIENMQEQQTGLFAMFIAKQADTSRIPELMTRLKRNNVWVVPTQALAERWFTPEKTAAAFREEPEMIYMNPNTLNAWTTSKSNLSANPKFNKEEINDFIKLRRKLIYECNKNGVGLLLGSDAPQVFNVPGFSVHQELQYLVDAGLTPYEALRTGTVNTGVYLNQAQELGTVTRGAIADLVLLNGNPLADIN